MIAFCGIDCTKCEAFTATQKNDDKLRAKVAKNWSNHYNVKILPEQINCSGCLSDGIKTYHCEYMCKIRKCAKGRNLQTCSKCNDYACSKLDEVFKYVPDAKKNLEYNLEYIKTKSE
ncbi:DUF3795 domain-containing protein [Desulfoscipio sp. XC116]|uniref:DUF3795 domain-containing protein n=1 Tax=Desulfoscipio sp. XC116 TaxID=3144975 RepID=UPI00325BA971